MGDLINVEDDYTEIMWMGMIKMSPGVWVCGWVSVWVWMDGVDGFIMIYMCKLG